uniref:Ovule protein n=1 Tax=Romanomermis culicivorax TaxID=13658 RepID=A0A915JB67_ROMCU
VTLFSFASDLFYTKAVKPSPFYYLRAERLLSFCCLRPKQPSIVFSYYTGLLPTIATIHFYDKA